MKMKKIRIFDPEQPKVVINAEINEETKRIISWRQRKI